MAAQVAQPSVLQSTYKVREAEGILDLYFYRPIGLRLAQIFAKINVTPAGVSLLGGLVGVIAGHLYFYRDLGVNVGGMVLHVLANALDNADGQLARMTGRTSRIGRIIDSLADHLVWISIYVHLTLRYLAEGASPAVCLLAIAAAISHGLQGAAADYFRTSYLYFVKKGKSFVDLDSSAALRSDYQDLSWPDQPWHKLLLALYGNFTRQQELLSPHLKRLREISIRFPQEIPESFRARYQRFAGPMFRLWGLLMTNTRMLILFIFLFIGQPVWYFWIELTVFNVLLVYLIYRQESMTQSLLELVPTTH
jgi:hypothetical protein